VLDRLIVNVSIKSDCTSTIKVKKGCSIEEVMKELHSIDEVQFGSELHTFSIEFFYLRSKREMWAPMRDIDRKFSRLKLMFKQNSKP
jgi:hypothetical protein